MFKAREQHRHPETIQTETITNTQLVSKTLFSIGLYDLCGLDLLEG